MIGEPGAAKRRHGILALAGPFEHVAGRIEAALKIAGFAANAHFLLNGKVAAASSFRLEP